MLQRASHLHLPTLREDPAEAEAASHRLSIRAALVRQVGAGLWTYLPLGWRVQQKITAIIREEMNRIGGQECSMPLLTPAELWQRSGRYSSPEVYKLSDRFDRPFVLALSHEETMTLAAQELRSYRQLPQTWYQFAVKCRNEPRARGGLLRVREFVMKDSYSFDRDEDGLGESFERHAAAYRAIFDRCGLDYYEVESDVGLMGGHLSIEFQAPCEAGEDEIAVCPACDYKANVQVARARASKADFPEPLASPTEVETPGAATIDAVSTQLGIDPRATIKAFPVIAGDAFVLALVRGDHRVNEFKLGQALGQEWRPARQEEIEQHLGAEGGSIGPVGATVDVVADEAIGPGQYVVGANRTGWHLRGAEPGRDFTPTKTADLRLVEAGDACPNCGSPLGIQTAIEIGNIFKLGTRFSEPFAAHYLDESGVEHPLVMGSYGIGLGRTMAAAIEQNHDEHGIIWPASIAPYDVHVVSLQATSAGVGEAAQSVGEALSNGGSDVLLDDREGRPGEKFADADLIGCPVRVTVGRKTLEDEQVDVRSRRQGEDQRVAMSELAQKVAEASS